MTEAPKPSDDTQLEALRGPRTVVLGALLGAAALGALWLLGKKHSPGEGMDFRGMK